jgi:TPR repeat protein
MEMVNLGILYERMDPPDLDAARGWYERAADAGDTDAMYGLGVLYAQLMDAPDLNAARGWWERAAALGHMEAARKMRELG